MTADQYKAIRLKLRLSQAELAERLGVSRVTVNTREAGKSPINSEAARAIESLAASTKTHDLREL